MEQDLDRIKQTIENRAEEVQELCQNISGYIFCNPELGGEEFLSSRYLADVLKDQGFQVDFPYESLPTAFIARYAPPEWDITIAFLAEYDALPGFGKDGGPGHACGHNWIAASMCGCAMALSAACEALRCRVFVIGTPAEETFGAKADLIRLGAFDEVDFAMQAHLDEFTSIEAKALAMNSIEFDFHGVAAHAAQSPERGVNALDAVISMFNSVNAMRQHVRQEARMHGIITKGGEATNIVPDFAQCQFSIRAVEKGYLKELRRRLLNIAEAAALSTGARLEYRDFENAYDDMINVPAFTRTCREEFEKLSVGGFIPEEEYPGAGSSDIGNVSYVCPTIYLEIALQSDADVIVHDQSAMETVNSQDAWDLMATVIRAFSFTAARVASDPQLQTSIKAQHSALRDRRLSPGKKY